MYIIHQLWIGKHYNKQLSPPDRGGDILFLQLQLTFINTHFPLAIVQWNALPGSVVCFQSLDAFKAVSVSCNTQNLNPKKACF